MKIQNHMIKNIAIKTVKSILVVLILLTFITGKAQTCNCENEFLFIKNTVEMNFSGFDDRIKTITREAYNKKVDTLLKLTHDKFANDDCPQIINRYLDIIKSHHLGIFGTSDPYKTDTAYANHRPIFNITNAEIERLKKSKSWEGIYYSIYDSSYKIAVVKDASPMHDYIGVMLESKLPTWKMGMLKFEGKLMNDSLLVGTLFMKNQRPKINKEYFLLWQGNNRIGGDWRRVETPKEETLQSNSSSSNESNSVIDAKILASNTLYIKIGSFTSDYKLEIDSLLKTNEHLLNSTSNLILDLRDNGGGSDNSWEGLIPYIYTKPIKMIGADILATETTISAYKTFLEKKNLSKEDAADINSKITRMKNAKGKWITNNDDEIDSSFKPKLFPKKIVILINKWCGSSTEEFLLAARQSEKVTLVGDNTIGNLDYSNIVEIPFSCFPYTLVYPTTRSRRLNINQGIDNFGIAPEYHLSDSIDWIKEASKILNQQK
jgi:hypothetical protein